MAHSKLGDAYRGLGETEKADYHTQFAESIKQKRIEITKASGILEREPNRFEIYDQIADLHRDLNESDTALRWERRGKAARAKTALKP